jgi:hypothetical protein
VGRRRFDHLVAEVSVAVGHLIPRYALWLRLHELGLDPENLRTSQANTFIRKDLDDFLAGLGEHVSGWRRRRLRVAVSRYDPRHPTPYETMERFGKDPGTPR